MKSDARGLYVHIPFCVRKCRYCDFCSAAEIPGETRARYLSSLCEEIRSYGEDEKLPVDTVFFGGGTPSLLAPSEFSAVASAIRETFDLSRLSEFTVECNPKTLSDEKLSAFLSAGVDRVSLGLQSADDGELSLLGRIHTYNDFLMTYSLLRSHSVKNINIDLMFGIPGQSVGSFSATLDRVIALAPEHISCYSLILEEGTPLYRDREKYVFPSEDEETEMYFLASEKLSRAGYRHYEISNFAKPGFECRHNLKYWRAEEYIGVGMAAHSYFRGKRFGNTTDFCEYFERFGQKYRTEEDSLGAKDAYEFAMLSLRTADGFSLSEYEARFGASFLSGREMALEKMEKAGYLSLSEDRLALTERGFWVSNEILTELL